jgi:hypothetical protein
VDVGDQLLVSALGAGSALLGALVGGLISARQERRAHQRVLRTRWDEPRLKAFASYLTTANCAHRDLLHVLWAERDADRDLRRAEARESFERLHADSEGVSLLTGARDDEVRTAAREVRQALEPLHLAALSGAGISRPQQEAASDTYRRARDRFIDAAQKQLGVKLHDW